MTLPGLELIELPVHADDRGWLREVYNPALRARFGDFAQTNVSHSEAGVLRGLHYQRPRAQAKLVCVLHGAVFDVAVDLRPGPTFGRWQGFHLDATGGRHLYVPAGFAHGFAVLEAPVVFQYRVSVPFDPDGQIRIRWDDPQLGIEWPLENPRLSPADAAAPFLADLTPGELP